MNERIQELLLETHRQTKGGIYNGHSFEWTEKFAELIVKECCQYLNNEAERLYALSASEHRPNFQENFEICAEKCYDNIQGIKEHFGVEQ